jgi:YbbR domain-containing protein
MKNFLTNNIWLKILCLLLGIGTWYLIRNITNYEITLYDIPISVNAPEGYAVLQLSDSTISITCRGAQGDIRLLDQKHIKAQFTLDTNTTGAIELQVKPSHLSGLHNVNIISIHPQKIFVVVDRQMTKKIPVKVKTTGEPQEGEIEELICDPAVASLTGPARQLATVDWLYTEPIDVNGVMESFIKRCKIQPPSNAWTPLIEPAEVQVKITILNKNETIEWASLPVVIMKTPADRTFYEISPANVRLVLKGTAKEIASFNEIVPAPFVKPENLNPSLVYDMPVQVFLPLKRNVEVIIVPSSVKVKVKATE